MLMWFFHAKCSQTPVFRLKNMFKHFLKPLLCFLIKIFIETVVWLSSSVYILLVHSCIWSWRSSGVMQHFVRQYRLSREKITCGSPTPWRQERGGESSQSSLRVLRGKDWHGYDKSSKQENWSLIKTIVSFSKDLSNIMSRWSFFNCYRNLFLLENKHLH